MQIDIHYYATYVIARVAGIKAEHAQIIASAAQYVDDGVTKELRKEFENGAQISPIITAHHGDSAKNLDRHDQRYVWIPFHFLPGDIGDELEERLICVKDSTIALEMVHNALRCHWMHNSDFLIGITAHVYADTFAHTGFSGISSSLNKVKYSSLQLNMNDRQEQERVENKTKAFIENTGNFLVRCFRAIGSTLIEAASGALGHGAVYTLPDKPFLNWAFSYEESRNPRLDFSVRDNQTLFLEALEALFDMFREYVELKPEIKDNTIDLEFWQIREQLRDCLKVEGDKETRSEYWKTIFRDHKFCRCSEHVIPEYLGHTWEEELRNIDQSEIIKRDTLDIHKFYSAAYYHRSYILNQLLPNHDIIVT